MPTADTIAVTTPAVRPSVNGIHRRFSLARWSYSGSASATVAGPSRKCTNCAPSKYVAYGVRVTVSSSTSSTTAIGDRVGERIEAHALVEPVREQVGEQRDGQAQQRRGRQVDPDLAELPRHGDGSRASHREVHSITSAVTTIASAVLASSATRIGSHSLAMRATCSITPTPAGTNSSDRCFSSSTQVGRSAATAFR